MKAIILAAGYATRLYPLTKDMPKALLPIGDKPIIQYILDQINTIDQIDEVIVVSNSKFYNHFLEFAKVAVTSKVLKVLDDGTDTEESRLGAIGDIQFAIEREKIDDDVIIIAGDNLFTYKLREYYDYYMKKGSDCVVVKQISDKNILRQFAVAKLDEWDQIIELVEKPEEPNSDIGVFATYIYSRDTIGLFAKYLAEGNKKDAPGYFVQWLYKEKPVYAYRMNGVCYDIGTHESYNEVKNGL